MKRLLTWLVFAMVGASSAQQSHTHFADGVVLNLVGVWEANDTLSGAGYDALYEFYQDGRFAYRTSQYDVLSRIVEIDGTYRVEGDFLYTRITSWDERVGGLLEHGEPEIDGQWGIHGYKIVTMKPKDLDEGSFLLSPCRDLDDSSRCFMIYGIRYFKIKNQPPADDYEIRESRERPDAAR